MALMMMMKNNLLLIAARLSFAVLFTYTASVGATTVPTLCKTRDIQILQFQDGTYPSGIPKFRVQISNTCTNPNCTISNILVHCGQFASASLVSPLEFRRIDHDICLVNDGKPITNLGVIAFTYGNTRDYPLSIASANITCNPQPAHRIFWQGHRFLNFLVACMVFAFVISRLFHFNVTS